MHLKKLLLSFEVKRKISLDSKDYEISLFCFNLVHNLQANNIENFGCEKKKAKLLNFSNSQPVFEVGADQIVMAVDLLKSLKVGNFL